MNDTRESLKPDFLSPGIVTSLNELSDLYDKLDRLTFERDAQVRDAIPEEVRLKTDQIKAAWQIYIDDVESRISELEQTITAATTILGKSVSGNRMSANYYKGRVSWDTTKLDGYAVAHPEILSMRKQGAPYAVIKWIKEKPDAG